MSSEPMRNLIEPQAFAALFRNHPPQGFFAEDGPFGTPVFLATLDLLTTADEATAARIRTLPLYRYWGRALRVSTRFCGTTTTEHCPLPRNVSAGTLLNALHTAYAATQPLFIVKDLPNASPLVSDEDNAYADELARAAREKGYIILEGEALAYNDIDFSDEDEYLSRLSAARRKNIRRKMRSREALDVTVLPLGDAFFDDDAVTDELYALFRQVYDNSPIHFDLLTQEYLTALVRAKDIPGVVFRYAERGETIGYNICLTGDATLTDKTIALNYARSRDVNLYHVSWMENLRYARTHGYARYVSGCTAVDAKASLGASFTMTRHLVWVRNPLLRRLLAMCRGLFEADAKTLQRSRHASSHS